MRHKFHAVPNDFPIPCDGIIGVDFLREFNCKLDFMENKDWLVLRPHNFQHFAIPITNITNNCINNSIMLPARSQVVRRVHIASKREELLVPNQEIQPGIYIANTIVQGNNAYVRILNTNSCDTALNTMEIITEDLSDYDIIRTTEDAGNRFERVIDKLKKNFPDQFKDTLTTLCTEYSDIFAIETESVTTNNFYKQKLRLSD